LNSLTVFGIIIQTFDSVHFDRFKGDELMLFDI